MTIPEKVVLYTDGGCHGNPGPGGWAWRIVGPGGTVVAERSGAEAATTNNRMELAAVIDGLATIGPGHQVEVITDSQYVRQGITNWIRSWRTNGWRTKARTPVKNVDLWQRLDELNASVGPQWSWVRGHTGHEHNEACDSLVQMAIATLRAH